MNEITVVNQQEVLGQDFKIYGDFENPLFLAKDVAKWIEHSAVHMMLKKIDSDEKVRNIVSTLGGNQEMWFLTEDGLYEVLMQSRKPTAKKFKKEVKRILKEIRQTGVSMTDQKAFEITHNPNALADLLLQAGEQLKQKELVIQEMKPKALFADSVSASKTSILVNELAKLIQQNGVDIGGNRLFEWLRNNNFLVKRKGSDWNTPTQRSMEQGLFEVVERTHNNPDGSIRISRTTKVTGKGQVYFINKFLKEKTA